MQQVQNFGARLPRDLAFRCILVCSCVACILYFVAFVTPNWIELRPEMQSTFQRLGLWMACFNGYVHPEDYVSKAYYGCWYIYYPEYYYIRSWLNPPWFYAVQMLSILTLIFLILAMVIAGRLACHRYLAKRRIEELPANLKQLKQCGVLHLLASSAILIQIIFIGLESLDREWMPRPDYNRLGFSYACACFANFASFFALAFVVIRFVGKSEEELLMAEQQQLIEPEDTDFNKPAGATGTDKKFSMSRAAAAPEDSLV